MSPPNAWRPLPLLALATVALHHRALVASFARLPPTFRKAGAAAPTARAAGGMGMATRSKPKKGKKQRKASATTPFDVAKSMVKSEKLYEELLVDSAKAWMNEDDDAPMEMTTEYIVAARGTPNGSNEAPPTGAADWIPVVQLCLVRPDENDDEDAVVAAQLRAAVASYRREIHHAACLAAPSAFRALPRNGIEYSVEPLASFHRHVYEDVIEGKRGAGPGMTKARAREILDLEAGCTDAAGIKTAYRKQSYQHHPDRVREDDKEAASDRFAQIRTAYDTLNSGVRRTATSGNGAASSPSSWYESLGGRDRTDFSGPLDLSSVEEVGALGNTACKSAVTGIDPDLAMTFVARNQAAARL